MGFNEAAHDSGIAIGNNGKKALSTVFKQGRGAVESPPGNNFAK